MPCKYIHKPTGNEFNTKEELLSFLNSIPITSQIPLSNFEKAKTIIQNRIDYINSLNKEDKSLVNINKEISLYNKNLKNKEISKKEIENSIVAILKEFNIPDSQYNLFVNDINSLPILINLLTIGAEINNSLYKDRVKLINYIINNLEDVYINNGIIYYKKEYPISFLLLNNDINNFSIEEKESLHVSKINSISYLFNYIESKDITKKKYNNPVNKYGNAIINLTNKEISNTIISDIYTYLYIIDIKTYNKLLYNQLLTESKNNNIVDNLLNSIYKNIVNKEDIDDIYITKYVELSNNNKIENTNAITQYKKEFTRFIKNKLLLKDYNLVEILPNTTYDYIKNNTNKNNTYSISNDKENNILLNNLLNKIITNFEVAVKSFNYYKNRKITAIEFLNNIGVSEIDSFKLENYINNSSVNNIYNLVGKIITNNNKLYRYYITNEFININFFENSNAIFFKKDNIFYELNKSNNDLINIENTEYYKQYENTIKEYYNSYNNFSNEYLINNLQNNKIYIKKDIYELSTFAEPIATIDMYIDTKNKSVEIYSIINNIDDTSINNYITDIIKDSILNNNLYTNIDFINSLISLKVNKKEIELIPQYINNNIVVTYKYNNKIYYIENLIELFQLDYMPSFEINTILFPGGETAVKIQNIEKYTLYNFKNYLENYTNNNDSIENIINSKLLTDNNKRLEYTYNYIVNMYNNITSELVNNNNAQNIIDTLNNNWYKLNITKQDNKNYKEGAVFRAKNKTEKNIEIISNKNYNSVLLKKNKDKIGKNIKISTNNLTSELGSLINHFNKNDTKFIVDNNNKELIDYLNSINALYTLENVQEVNNESLPEYKKAINNISLQDNSSLSNDISILNSELDNKYFKYLLNIYNEKYNDNISSYFSNDLYDKLIENISVIDVIGYAKRNNLPEIISEYVPYYNFIKQNYINTNSEYYKYILSLTNNNTEQANKLYLLTKQPEFKNIYGDLENNTPINNYLSIITDPFYIQVITDIIKTDNIIADKEGLKYKNPDKFIELSLNKKDISVITNDPESILSLYTSVIPYNQLEKNNLLVTKYVISDDIISEYSVDNNDILNTNTDNYIILSIYDRKLFPQIEVEDTITDKKTITNLLIPRLKTGEPLISLSDFLSFEKSKNEEQPIPEEEESEKEKNKQKEIEQNKREYISNNIIEKLTKIFKARFNTNVVVIEDNSTTEHYVLKIDSNEYRELVNNKTISLGDIVIKVNTSILTKEHTIHEFGHIFLDIIGFNDPIIQEGISIIKDTLLYDIVKETYEERYNYNEDIIGIEALTTAIGQKGNKIFSDINTENIFKNWLNKLYYYIKNKIQNLLYAVKKYINIPAFISPDIVEMLAYDLILGTKKYNYKPSTFFTKNNFYHISKEDREKITVNLESTPGITTGQKTITAKILESTKDLYSAEKYMEYLKSNSYSDLSTIEKRITYFVTLGLFITNQLDTPEEQEKDILKQLNDYYIEIDESDGKIKNLYLRQTVVSDMLFKKDSNTEENLPIANILAERGTILHEIFEKINNAIAEKLINISSNSSIYEYLEKNKDDILNPIITEIKQKYSVYFSTLINVNINPYKTEDTLNDITNKFFQLIARFKNQNYIILSEVQLKMTNGDIFKKGIYNDKYINNDTDKLIKGIASTMDIILIDTDGNLSILDIKNLTHDIFNSKKLIYSSSLPDFKDVNVVVHDADMSLFSQFETHRYNNTNKSYYIVTDKSFKYVHRYPYRFSFTRNTGISKAQRYHLQLSINKRILESVTNSPVKHIGQIINSIPSITYNNILLNTFEYLINIKEQNNFIEEIRKLNTIKNNNDNPLNKEKNLIEFLKEKIIGNFTDWYILKKEIKKILSQTDKDPIDFIKDNNLLYISKILDTFLNSGIISLLKNTYKIDIENLFYGDKFALEIIDKILDKYNLNEFIYILIHAINLESLTSTLTVNSYFKLNPLFFYNKETPTVRELLGNNPVNNTFDIAERRGFYTSDDIALGNLSNTITILANTVNMNNNPQQFNQLTSEQLDRLVSKLKSAITIYESLLAYYSNDTKNIDNSNVKKELQEIVDVLKRTVTSKQITEDNIKSTYDNLLQHINSKLLTYNKFFQSLETNKDIKYADNNKRNNMIILLDIIWFIQSNSWINDIIVSEYTNTSLFNTMQQLYSNINSIKELTTKYMQEIKELIVTDLSKYTSNPAIIQDTLNILRGKDLYFAQAWLDGAIYADNPLLSLFAKKATIATDLYNNMGNELIKQFYRRLRNYLSDNTSNLDDFFQKITINNSSFNTGEFIKEYSDDIYIELLNKLAEIETLIENGYNLFLTDTSNNISDADLAKLAILKSKEKELNKFLFDNFLRPYVDEYYIELQETLSIIDEEHDIDLDNIPEYFKENISNYEILTDDEKIKIIKSMKGEAANRIKQASLRISLYTSLFTSDRMTVSEADYKTYEELVNFRYNILTSIEDDEFNEKEKEEKLIALIIKDFDDKSSYMSKKYFTSYVNENFNRMYSLQKQKYEAIINDTRSSENQKTEAERIWLIWKYRNLSKKIPAEFYNRINYINAALENVKENTDIITRIKDKRKSIRNKFKRIKDIHILLVNDILLRDILDYKQLIDEKTNTDDVFMKTIISAVNKEKEQIVKNQEYYNNTAILDETIKKEYQDYIDRKNAIIDQINNILAKYIDSDTNLLDPTVISEQDLKTLQSFLSILKYIKPPIILSDRNSFLTNAYHTVLDNNLANSHLTKLKSDGSLPSGYLEIWKSIFMPKTTTESFWELYNTLKEIVQENLSEDDKKNIISFNKEIYDIISPYLQVYGDNFDPLIHLSDGEKLAINALISKKISSYKGDIYKAVKKNIGKSIIYTQKFLEKIKAAQIADTEEIKEIKKELNSILSKYLDDDTGTYVDLEKKLNITGPTNNQKNTAIIADISNIYDILKKLKRQQRIKNQDTYAVLEEYMVKEEEDIDNDYFIVSLNNISYKLKSISDYITLYKWLSAFAKVDVFSDTWNKDITEIFNQLSTNYDADASEDETLYLETRSKFKTPSNEISITDLFHEYENSGDSKISILNNRPKDESKGPSELDAEVLIAKLHSISKPVFTKEFIYFLINNNILDIFISTTSINRYKSITNEPIQSIITKQYGDDDVSTLLEVLPELDESSYDILINSINTAVLVGRISKEMGDFLKNYALEKKEYTIRKGNNEITITTYNYNKLVTRLIPLKPDDDSKSDFLEIKANPLFFSFFKTDNDNSSGTYNNEIVDIKKTEALATIKTIISYDTIKAYKTLLEKVQKESIEKDIPFYETVLWKENHVFNFFTQKWEPISIWTKLITSEHYKQEEPSPIFYGNSVLKGEYIDDNKTNLLQQRNSLSKKIFTDEYRKLLSILLNISLDDIPFDSLNDLSPQNFQTLKDKQININGTEYSFLDLFHTINPYTQEIEPLDIFTKYIPKDTTSLPIEPASHHYTTIIHPNYQNQQYKTQKEEHLLTNAMIEYIKVSYIDVSDFNKLNISSIQITEEREISTQDDESTYIVMCSNFLQSYLLHNIYNNKNVDQLTTEEKTEYNRLLTLLLKKGVKYKKIDNNTYIYFNLTEKDFNILLPKELISILSTISTDEIFNEQRLRYYLKSKLIGKQEDINYQLDDIIPWEYDSFLTLLNITLPSGITAKDFYINIENTIVKATSQHKGMALPNDTYKNKDFIALFGTDTNRTPVQAKKYEFFLYIKELLEYLTLHNPNTIIAKGGLPAVPADTRELQKNNENILYSLFAPDPTGYLAQGMRKLNLLREYNTQGEISQYLSILGVDNPEDISTIIVNINNLKLNFVPFHYISRLNQLNYLKPINAIIEKLKVSNNKKLSKTEFSNILRKELNTIDVIKSILDKIGLRKETALNSLIEEITENAAELYRDKNDTANTDPESIMNKLIELITTFASRPEGFYEYVNRPENVKLLQELKLKNKHEDILDFYDNARKSHYSLYTSPISSSLIQTESATNNTPIGNVNVLSNFVFDEHLLNNVTALFESYNIVTTSDAIQNKIKLLYELQYQQESIDSSDENRLSEISQNINKLRDEIDKELKVNQSMSSYIVKTNSAITMLNKILHGTSVDYDLVKTIPAFIRAAMDNKAKTEIELLYLHIYSALSLSTDVNDPNSIVFDSTENLYNKIASYFSDAENIVKIAGANSSVLESLKAFARKELYNDPIDKYDQLKKLSRKLMNYTSLTLLGFNFLTAANNKVYGELQIRIEKAANEYFGHEDFTAADQFYYHNELPEKEQYQFQVDYGAEFLSAMQEKRYKDALKYTSLSFGKGLLLNLKEIGNSLEMYIGAALGGLFFFTGTPLLGIIAGGFGGLVAGYLIRNTLGTIMPNVIKNRYSAIYDTILKEPTVAVKTAKSTIQRKINKDNTLLSYLDDVNGHELKSSTLAGAIIKEMNIMQSVDELIGINGGEVNTRFHIAKMINSTAYFLMHVGEHSMQNKTLFAMMIKYKIDSEGEIYRNVKDYIKKKNLTPRDSQEFAVINNEYYNLDRLIDIYELNDDGYLRIKDGKNLNPESLAKFKIEVKAVNHYLHGVYSEREKGRLSEYWWGKLILQMRNWMRFLWARRFGNKFGESYWNEGLNNIQEGYYYTAYKVVKNILKIILSFNNVMDNIYIYWNQMDDYEKANVKRMMQEIEYFFIWVTLFSIYISRRKEQDDDWKNEPITVWVAYELSRIRSEFATFYPIAATYPEGLTFGWINEANKFMKSPFAGVATIKNIINLTKGIFGYIGDDEDAYYKGGINYGKSKAWVSTKKLLPFVGQMERLVNLEKNNRYYRLF